MNDQGYFSQSYEQRPKFQYTKQLMFIDARDYTNEINENLEFTVVLSQPMYAPNRDDWSSVIHSLNISPYEEVTQVELKAISFPKIADESYYILDIPEFSGRLHSSDNTGSHETFAIVYYNDTVVGDATPAKGADFDEKIHVFNPPLKHLNKFRIRFKKHGGDIIKKTEFAADADAADAAVKKITLLFEFTIKK